jgi:hypothetical protein
LQQEAQLENLNLKLAQQGAKTDALTQMLNEEREQHKVVAGHVNELQQSGAEYTRALANSQRSLDEKSCIL